MTNLPEIVTESDTFRPTPIETAAALVERLENDLSVQSPEAVEQSIHEREDCRNALQSELNAIDDQIDALDSRKRAIRHTRALLKTGVEKLISKKFELLRERKATDSRL